LLAGVEPPAIQKGARANARFEDFPTNRIDDGGEDRDVVFDQGQRDHPIVAALNEGAGAVDRVDNPDAPGMQAIIMLAAFFGEPAITGARAFKPCCQKLIHSVVCFRYLRTIGLTLLLDGSAPIAQRELSGFLSSIADKIEVLCVIVLHAS
jgi:hypothetical protein